MNFRIFLIPFAMAFICNYANADLFSELSKRDYGNAIHFDYSGGNVSQLYMENGYLITEHLYIEGVFRACIVAYQIQDNAIKLIIRNTDRDFAYRMIDSFDYRDSEQYFVTVQNYYLVELVYVNDKLEYFCNRIRDINANGFMFNEAKIGENASYLRWASFLEYGDGINLVEGMETRIESITRELQDIPIIKVYDYVYNVLINDKILRLNGVFLDFSNKIKLF
jgi:hypothetical protein